MLGPSVILWGPPWCYNVCCERGICGCSIDCACLLLVLWELLSAGVCSQPSCHVPAEEVLSRRSTFAFAVLRVLTQTSDCRVCIPCWWFAGGLRGSCSRWTRPGPVTLAPPCRTLSNPSPQGSSSEPSSTCTLFRCRCSSWCASHGTTSPGQGRTS